MPGFTVTIVGGSAEDDSASATLIVMEENARRELQEPPLPPLPLDPPSARVASAETTLGTVSLPDHWALAADRARKLEAQNKGIQQLWRGATNAGRDLAEQALEDNQTPPPA